MGASGASECTTSFLRWGMEARSCTSWVPCTQDYEQSYVVLKITNFSSIYG